MNAPYKILVVDDNEAMRYSVCRWLRSEERQVFEAASGEECLILALKHQPDLILLDVRLPGLNGHDALKRLKRDPFTSRIFVVHLSALAKSPSETASALAAGADGYISHPIEKEELIARVDAFLRLKRALSELQESESRYRGLFDNNPQPVLLYRPHDGRIIKANRAASELYGYSPEELERLKLSSIQDAPIPDSADPPDQRTIHRGRNGRVIPVEVATHSIDWDAEPVSAAIVTDLSDRAELEQERTLQREQFKGEMRSLHALTRNRQTPVTSKMIGSSPLCEAAPDDCGDMVVEYGAYLELALDEQIYRVDHKLGAHLKPLAERLARLRAGPRDVVYIHYSALKSKTAELEHAKARGYVEAGRLLLLELMGLLVTAYRGRGMQPNGPTGPIPKRGRLDDR